MLLSLNERTVLTNFQLDGVYNGGLVDDNRCRCLIRPLIRLALAVEATLCCAMCCQKRHIAG